MPLSPATRFGPYEIVAPLGAGGMGEVYRARDTRLGRDVALKVLPADVSADTARRARFEQEARSAAALNHPNIVGLHDVGDQDGVFYIVAELVPGETLAALLEAGPLPTRKLLDIAVQIADGMAAAHAARITHRDLKPANIIVTAEGRAKILDFGLAKQAAAAAAAPDATITVQQTQPGMILGTVSYMSPEQARGRTADYRSDQFSFGVILYEMAAGRKAFDRPESVQTMSAILTEDPPPIERDIPAPLRWTIDRCLAKDPADRYESSRDLFRELRQIRDYAGSKSASQITPAVEAPARPKRRIGWVFPAVATAACIGAFALGRYFTEQRFPDQSAYHFAPFAFDPGGQESPVWSPDGKAVAYAVRPGGAGRPFQVVVRYLEQAMGQPVTRIAEDAIPLAWSPDSMRILFQSSRAPGGIWSVSSVGGEPESFYPVKDARGIAVSPDLKAVAFVRQGDDGAYAVWISSPPGAAPRKYEPDPIASRALYNRTNLRFSPDGKQLLLLMKGDRGRDETWLLPFPPASGRAPKLVLPGLPTYSGTPNIAWLPDNRRILLSFSPTPDSAPQLWLADLEHDRRTALTSGTSGHGSVAVSPDGAKIVYAEPSGSYDVVSLDLQRVAATRLVATGRDESMPAWAADDNALVYVTDREGGLQIWLRNHTGDHPAVRAADFPPGTTQWFMGPALSPDGQRIAYARLEFQGGSRLWLSSAAGGAPVRMTDDPSSGEFPGSWSPDGRSFAYLAVRNGKMDLMKVKTSGQAAPELVLAGADCETPSWTASDWIVCAYRLISPDGKTVRELHTPQTKNFAPSKDGKLLYGLHDEPDRETLFSVDIATGATRTLGSVGREFRPGSGLHPAVRFSLAPDGASFVYAAGDFHSDLWMLTGALKP